MSTQETVSLCLMNTPQRLIVARAVATGTSRADLHCAVEAIPVRAVELSLGPDGLTAAALVSHRGAIVPTSVLDGQGVCCRIVMARWPPAEDAERVEGAAPGLMSQAIEKRLALIAKT